MVWPLVAGAAAMIGGSLISANAQKKAAKGSIAERPSMTPEQLALLRDLNVKVRGELGKGVPGYTGQRTAPTGQIQGQVFDKFSSLLNQPQFAMGQNNAYNQGQQALAQMVNGQQNEKFTPRDFNFGRFNQQAPDTRPYQEFDPKATQQFFQDTVQRPMMRQFEEMIMPQVRERYNAAGAASSGAALRAENRARTDLANNMTSQLSNMMYNAQQAQVNRETGREMDNLNRMAAIGQANQNRAAGLFGQNLGQNFQGQQAEAARNMARMQFGVGSSLDYARADIGQQNQNISNLLQALQAGNIQRGIGQEKAENDYQEWLRTRDYNNPWLDRLGFALQNPNPNVIARAGSPGAGGALGGLLQMGGMNMMGGQGFFGQGGGMMGLGGGAMAGGGK